MKRLLAALIFISLFFQIFSPHALAQTATPSAQPANIPPGRVNSDVPNNYGTHTQMVLIEIMAALTCQIAGIDPVNPNGKCLGVDPNTGKIGFVENGGGAITVAQNLIVGTFNFPTSSTHYVQYLASDFGISKNTYAQENTGEGFEKIEPLISVWLPFRNLVYILFVIAFMLIGFGIVFRFKIDPKTVMTIQNSIPKIIITLVLVTFSFAIAGFLIDVMYLLMYILYELFASIEGTRLGDLSPGNVQSSTPFGALGAYGGIDGLSFHAASSVGDIIDPIVKELLAKLIPGSSGGAWYNPMTYANRAVSWAGGEIVGALATGITLLIFFIALLSALFRLWFVLLRSYLFIIIDIVVAPIWIVGSLIPGSPLSAGTWFKHIFKYLAVFPVTFFMFLLGATLVQIFDVNGTTTFTAPLIGASIDPKHLGALLGLALLLMTPEVINMIQDVINAPVNKYQAAIGKAVGTGTSVSSAPVKRAKDVLFKKDADGTPVGPGAIAGKYLWKGTKSKVGAGKAWVGNKIPDKLKPSASNLPDGFRRKIRPLGWIRDRQLEEDANYRRYNPNAFRRGSFERADKDAEVARKQLSAQNATLLQQVGNNINIDISPNYTNEETAPIAEELSKDPARAGKTEAENWHDAQQQILHGQLQQIQMIQSKLNSGQVVTDVDKELFKGLASNIANDPNFQMLFVKEKNNPANPNRNNNDEVRKIALRQYQQLYPIFARRYALYEKVKERE